MTLATIAIPNQQLFILQNIAHETGQNLEDLVSEVIEQFIQQFKQRQRLALLRQARGMWANRTDLPDLVVLRAEFERGELPHEAKIVT